MAKHIGIVGCSAEGAALCYRTICTDNTIHEAFQYILPNTPFLLLAAACYLRSSERFSKWLLHNRFFGNYIRNYLKGNGMPKKTKAAVILLLWATILLSVFFGTENLWVRIALGVIAAGVTTHIVLIKPRGKGKEMVATGGFEPPTKGL